MITVTTDVFCDGCVGVRDNWTHGVVANNVVLPRSARENAARQGWTRRRVDKKLVDLCPQCTALIAAGQPLPRPKSQ